MPFDAIDNSADFFSTFLLETNLSHDFNPTLLDQSIQQMLMSSPSSILNVFSETHLSQFTHSANFTSDNHVNDQVNNQSMKERDDKKKLATPHQEKQKKRIRWTTDANNLLINLVKTYEFRKIKWKEIALQINLLMGTQLTNKGCHERWSIINPSLNHSKWSQEEDDYLFYLVTIQPGKKNWIEIAENLGTKRSNAQCLSRYKNKLYSRTVEENEKLQELIRKHGKDNWKEISEELSKWHHLLPGNILPLVKTNLTETTKKVVKEKKIFSSYRRWSFAENKQLHDLVMASNEDSIDWKTIASKMDDRTSRECSEHWKNVLNPSINHQPWTAEEKSRLIAIVESNKGKKSWIQIAQEHGNNRTNVQCNKCYRHIFMNRNKQIQKLNGKEPSILGKRQFSMENPPAKRICLEPAPHVDHQAEKNDIFYETFLDTFTDEDFSYLES